MNGNDKNIHPFPASVIEKYLNGELSAPEMHELEKAALEDPFLADALDGMALHRQLPGRQSFREDIEELQERLEKRVAQNDSAASIPMFRMTRTWKAAAAIILLLGLGITAYYTVLNPAAKQNGDLARSIAHKSATPSPPPARSTAPSPAPAVASDSIAIAVPAGTVAPYTTTQRASTVVASWKSAKARTKPEAPIKGPDSTANRIGQPEQEHDKAAAAAAPLNKYDSKYKSDSTWASRSAAPMANNLGIPDQLVFSGKVIDQNNNALAGASLFMKGHDGISAVTDKNGFFSVRLRKSDSAQKLTVVYTGYEEASLALNIYSRTSNVIQLQRQPASFNEVVITGYGAKRKETLRRDIDTPPTPPSLIAFPAEGWPAYNTYLDINKKLPYLDSTLAGNETISFIVNKKGVLSSFKVQQSISPAHDSAAIRIIRQGPSWKLLKGHSARAVVTIIFP